MSVSASQSLPEYGNPPVDEVVCGVLFEPIKAFLVPHFGLLWEKFRPEYPNCQEVPPLMPTIESFEEFPPAEIEIPEIPLPRVWFLHDDGRIIQVQRDRFLHNWRKFRSTDEYPRYRKVFHMFQMHLSTFQEFLNELRLGTVTPRQYEMTYVNLIPQGEGWETTSDVHKVFPDFCWQGEKERFLPAPDGINWRTSFPLPNRAGRLHMHIQTARRRDDKRRLFRFEITARGIGTDTSSNAMQAWFDLAHEWIVRGFADSTGPQIQRDVWRRKT
jgi:uncharacterized protein (TIGR04255 family)